MRLAAADRRRSDELEFLKDAYSGQYSAFGVCSPKWDARREGSFGRMGDRMDPLRCPAEIRMPSCGTSGLTALDAGCTDPLLTHAVARNKVFWQGDGKEIRSLEIRAARAMKGSGYHGIHQIICLLRGAQYMVTRSTIQRRRKRQRRWP